MSDLVTPITLPGTHGRIHMLDPLKIVDSLPEWVGVEVKPSRDKAYFRARYVHGGLPANANGHIFRTEQLIDAHKNLPHTHVNWLHQTKHTIGCFVASRLVDEKTGAVISDARQVDGYTESPYVDTVGALWRFAYPDEYTAVQRAYDAGMAFVSCEAFPVANTCPTCDSTFEWKGYVSDTYCEHLNRRRAPRWLEHPLYVGGAVVVPPSRPGWKDAAITRIARWMGSDADAAESLFNQVQQTSPHLSQLEVEAMMSVIIENTTPEALSDPVQLIAPMWETVAGRYSGRVDLVPPAEVAAAAATGVIDASDLTPIQVHRALNLARRSPQPPATIRRIAAEMATYRVSSPEHFAALGGSVVLDWAANTSDAMTAVDVETAKPDNPTAVLVARPPLEIAEQLSSVAGFPVDQVHVTILFLGDLIDGALPGPDDSSFTAEEVATVVQTVVAGHEPLTATVNGQGVFHIPDDKVAVWAAIDCPGITNLHVDISDALSRVQVPFSRAHGFTAHSTVSVQPEGDPVPEVPTGMSWQVTELELWWDGSPPTVIPFAVPEDGNSEQ